MLLYRFCDFCTVISFNIFTLVVQVSLSVLKMGLSMVARMFNQLSNYLRMKTLIKIEHKEEDPSSDFTKKSC